MLIGTHIGCFKVVKTQIYWGAENSNMQNYDGIMVNLVPTMWLISVGSNGFDVCSLKILFF